MYSKEADDVSKKLNILDMSDKIPILESVYRGLKKITKMDLFHV